MCSFNFRLRLGKRQHIFAWRDGVCFMFTESIHFSLSTMTLPHHLDLLKFPFIIHRSRAVFSNQLTRLLSPLDNVVKSEPQGEVLTDEFTRLTSLVCNILNSPGPDQHDRVCRLNLELQKVVSEIRELPDLS